MLPLSGPACRTCSAPEARSPAIASSGSVRHQATPAPTRAVVAAIVLRAACRPVRLAQRRHNIFALHAGHEDGRCKE